ncbi:MAG: hypothetical protein IJ583_01025 [Firmicutes bacterium]|nr:hypothetical protein [Bacillota bacterium]
MASYKQLTETALLPVGKTMYIYGGGWNEADEGSGEDSMRIGISEKWVEYFEKQDKNYDYTKTRYLLGMGLDCSGYIGWLVYNLFPCESGYVRKAATMAEYLADVGFGIYKEKENVKDHIIGDIMSGGGHVYMVLGKCGDGSLVIVHSSPNGVQVNGTVDIYGSEKSEAVAAAEKYMKKNCPVWYGRYDRYYRGIEYLREYSQMRWTVLSDEENYKEKHIEEILCI